MWRTWILRLQHERKVLSWYQDTAPFLEHSVCHPILPPSQIWWSIAFPSGPSFPQKATKGKHIRLSIGTTYRQNQSIRLLKQHCLEHCPIGYKKELQIVSCCLVVWSTSAASTKFPLYSDASRRGNSSRDFSCNTKKSVSSYWLVVSSPSWHTFLPFNTNPTFVWWRVEESVFLFGLHVSGHWIWNGAHVSIRWSRRLWDSRF